MDILSRPGLSVYCQVTTSFLIEDENTLFDNFFDRLSAFMSKPKHKLLELVVNILTQLDLATNL